MSYRPQSVVPDFLRARPSPRLGPGTLGGPTPPKTQGDVAMLFSQRYGKYYLQDQTLGETVDYTNLLVDIKNGNWTAFGNDAAMTISEWLGMEVGGPLFAAFLQTLTSLEIDFNTPDQYPCTIQGCGSTFGGMAECSVTNEFAWDQIGANFVYVPPQGSNLEFQLGPNGPSGAAGMLWWGSGGWRQTNIPDPNHPGQFLFDDTDPTMKGGPDSFEWALEQAVLAIWNQWSTPPGICNVIAQVGGDGNINRSYGGGALANKVWTDLMARLGALVVPMIVAWNKTHTTGVIRTQRVCVKADCPGSFYPFSQGSPTGYCSSGGVQDYCYTLAAAPQREISYTVSSYAGGYASSNDPLQMAFDGLALLAGIPPGSTISVLVNSGPEIPPNPGTGVSPGTPATLRATSSGTTVLLVLGGLAALGAGGVYLYGRQRGMTFTQTVRSGWNHIRHPRGGSPRRLPKKVGRR